MGSEEVTLLGESDFCEAIEGPVRAWQEENVRQGELSAKDGTLLRYYYAVPAQPTACIVMVHGFCEFYLKYREMTWYFYQAGYAFFFLEQRGHGYSGGKMPEQDLVYIEDYRAYVEDLHQFLDEIVLPKAKGLDLILFAHSMGGAVATLFLERYPAYFKKAIFSSPMLRMKAGYYPTLLCLLLWVLLKCTGKGRELASGQHHFDGVPSFETSSTLSKPRYDYIFRCRLQDPHYQTYGACNAWAVASMLANHRLLRCAKKLQTPVMVFTAGQDHLIDPAGLEELRKKVPAIRTKAFPSSRHEIFHADEPTRKAYFEALFAELSGISS